MLKLRSAFGAPMSAARNVLDRSECATLILLKFAVRGGCSVQSVPLLSSAIAATSMLSTDGKR